MELDHVVLEVENPETSARYYQAVFGFPPVRLEEFRSGDAPFLSARINPGLILDFFPPIMWAQASRAANPNHLCFALSSKELGNLRRRLSRRGIAILRRSARNYGARGWGRSLYFPDPDGITLEARSYEGLRQT